jgi:hypothetical protein
MSFLQREDLNEILLKSYIASNIVYQEDPIKYLKESWLKSVDHQIEEICFSRKYENNLKYFNNLNEISYLTIKDSKKKKLFICFRGTQNISDLLVDVKLNSKISNVNGRFHSGFYYRAQNVPTGHFVDKLFNEGYELIFTGHSLGAAIAAMITIDILYMLDMTSEYAKKILFIGYGSPSVADIYFKNDVNLRYKDNFIFIKNENDIVVEILEYISNTFIDNKNDKNVESLYNFINYILSNINQQNNIAEKCKQMKLIVGTMARLLVPQYTHFGTLYQLNIKGGLSEVTNFEFNKKVFSEMFNDPGLLISKVQNHFVDNYFRNLKINYFERYINPQIRNESINLQINRSNDLNIDEIEPDNVKELLVNKMRDNSDLIIILKKLRNIEYIVAIELIISDDHKIFYDDQLPLPLDDFSIYFKFNCANSILYDENNNESLKIKKFIFKFYSHFNSNPIQIEIPIKNVKKLEENKNEKQKLIDNMPFDLLYLHAAYLINSLQRMNHNELNEKFIEIKDLLLEKFNTLDTLLEEIWKEKPESECSYSQNDLNEIRNLAHSYFKQLKIESEFNAIIELFDNIKFETENKGFKKYLESKENIQGLNNIELLISFLPFLFEIKKRTCKISSLSGKLNDKIFEVSFIKKFFVIGATSFIKDFHIHITTIYLACIFTGSLFMAVAASFVQAYRKGPELDYSILFNFDYDKVYYSIVKQANKINIENPIDDNLAYFENNYDQNFIENYPEEKDKLIFKLILINKQIRDILKKYYLFGSIGTKNTGKSRFVELITNQNADSHVGKTTKFSKAYSILNENSTLLKAYDEFVIIDYPHTNSNDLSEKIEFYFTRQLLDHIYLILNSEDAGSTDNENKLFSLVKNNNFNRFNILYNKSDRFFESDDNSDNNSIKFENFKKELMGRMKRLCPDFDLYSHVFFTCMVEQLMIRLDCLEPDVLMAKVMRAKIISDEMKKNDIILRNSLKIKVYENMNELMNVALIMEKIHLKSDKKKD